MPQRCSAPHSFVARSLRIDDSSWIISISSKGGETGYPDFRRSHFLRILVKFPIFPDLFPKESSLVGNHRGRRSKRDNMELFSRWRASHKTFLSLLAIDSRGLNRVILPVSRSISESIEVFDLDVSGYNKKFGSGALALDTFCFLLSRKIQILMSCYSQTSRIVPVKDRFIPLIDTNSTRLCIIYLLYWISNICNYGRVFPNFDTKKYCSWYAFWISFLLNSHRIL